MRLLMGSGRLQCLVCASVFVLLLTKAAPKPQRVCGDVGAALGLQTTCVHIKTGSQSMPGPGDFT